MSNKKMRAPIKNDNTSNTEERKFRDSFVRWFDKYDLRNEEGLVKFGRRLIFVCLLMVEISILFRYLGNFHAYGGWPIFGQLCGLIGVLTLSQALKLFFVKQHKNRIVLYILDACIASGFIFFTTGVFPLLIYLLILTQFYLNIKRVKSTFALFIGSILLYALIDVLQAAILSDTPLQLTNLLMHTMEVSFALAVHFIIVQVGLAFYRQFIKLDRALKSLDASKKELEKAYEAVVEVTALEERQRIAKEIHDTAGHSLTTVIMQTESAKLMLESNPEEAKGKIIAANLQAKHALEELRDSVHLLSGVKGNVTLKMALLDVIHESTDGTGIVIRSEIEDMNVSPTKFRFICNTLKEGISNGLRHGGATAFWFELKEETGEIYFLLSDNGKGIDRAKLQLGFGLSTMIDRAKSLGGEVRIESEIGEGLELHLLLPADA